MGHLSHNDERPADRTGQASRDQNGRHWRNLETADGEVPDLSDGSGGEGRLWDRPTGRESGRGDRGQHTCHERPLGGALVGKGLGFFPN